MNYSSRNEPMSSLGPCFGFSENQLEKGRGCFAADRMEQKGQQEIERSITKTSEENTKLF